MKKLRYACFCILKFFVRLFYPKFKLYGLENLPKSPSIVVGNHTKMNGPLVGELYFPENFRTWCAGEMMHFREVPKYAFQDFWSHKPKALKPFYKLLSYIITPLAICIFNSAKTLPVYHDKRVVATFRESVKAMKSGESLIIFPEHSLPYNDILCDFQEGFIDTAKIYYKQTKREVCFAPLYIAPALKSAYIGKPIAFNPDNDIKEERQRICRYLMEEITAIAKSLPRHKVVPYNNIPKKQYRFNKED